MAFDRILTPMDRKMGEALHAASIYFKQPVTRSRVLDKSRSRYNAEPRQWMMAYIRWRYGDTMSYPRIARMFNKKDHTTVMHAEHRAKGYWPDAIFVVGFSPSKLDRILEMQAELGVEAAA